MIINVATELILSRTLSRKFLRYQRNPQKQETEFKIENFKGKYRCAPPGLELANGEKLKSITIQRTGDKYYSYYEISPPLPTGSQLKLFGRQL